MEAHLRRDSLWKAKLMVIPTKKPTCSTKAAMQPSDTVAIVGTSLSVELDDTKGLNKLKECIARSGASPPQFAHMMGVTAGCMRLWLSGKRALSPLAIRAAYFCAAMSGVPVHMPNPARYLAASAKRR
jgi:hypothetical protein